VISPEAAKVYDVFRNAPKQVDMDLHHEREVGEHAEDMTSEPVGVEYQDVPELGGLWMTPRNGVGDAAIMYLYGGGYVISSPHSRRKLGGHLANASGANGLIPQDGLAPEHPFPAAVEDAAAAYRWLLGKASVPSGSSSPGIRAPAGWRPRRC
jgi:monoterpene epsilon-lactone hydrolase